jgi:hypothetical protein
MRPRAYRYQCVCVCVCVCECVCVCVCVCVYVCHDSLNKQIVQIASKDIGQKQIYTTTHTHIHTRTHTTVFVARILYSRHTTKLDLQYSLPVPHVHSNHTLTTPQPNCFSGSIHLASDVRSDFP